MHWPEQSSGVQGFFCDSQGGSSISQLGEQLQQQDLAASATSAGLHSALQHPKERRRQHHPCGRARTLLTKTSIRMLTQDSKGNLAVYIHYPASDLGRL